MITVLDFETYYSRLLFPVIPNQPEGTEEEYAISSFVCPEEGSTTTELMSLDLPVNLVPDSARGKVTVIGMY